LGWVSLGLGALSLGASVIGGLSRSLGRLGQQSGEFSEAFGSRFSSGGPRQMNLVTPPATSSGSVASLSNDYVAVFRHAIAENRIRQVENPRGSGFYTIGMETNGLPENSQMQYLRRRLFTPRGDNSTIEVIDNITPLTNGTHQLLNIGNEDFEVLYLQFIDARILSNRNLSDAVIGTVNRLRLATRLYLLDASAFEDNTINMMKRLWKVSGFSNSSVSEWLYYNLRYLSPDLNFPNDIAEKDNAFQFFNHIIIPNIRG
ncbi:hypothetical protein, partial [Xenorhabdus sp. SGI240]|uniref:hypothetical protein n=1 Tax=Xenorhabdus sp. SGI240 TaxID=3158262 RepID=UPI0032B82205